jgi:hypothetical protein
MGTVIKLQNRNMNGSLGITDFPDIKQWNKFVYKHEYGNIFQTPEMAEVYNNPKRREIKWVSTKN